MKGGAQMNLNEIIQRFRGVNITLILDSTPFPIATGEVLDGPTTVPGFLNLRLTAAYDSFAAGTTVLFSPRHIIAVA